MKAIGDDGAARIRDFVAEGGAYIGFCGGAGWRQTKALHSSMHAEDRRKSACPVLAAPYGSSRTATDSGKG